MKNRILILSALVYLCGATTAGASECTGAGCNFEPMYYGGIQEPTVLAGAQPTTVPMPPARYTVQTVPSVTQYSQPIDYVYPSQMPIRQAKLLSIKPVPADNRPAVWDGTTGNYEARGYDKTVDWRDGVPVWDDSISDYTKKDFSDWFLQQSPELYLRESEAAVTVAPQPRRDPRDEYALQLYAQNMEDAATTRARVEELLAPRVPMANLWTEPVQPAQAPDCVPDEDIIGMSNRITIQPRPEYVAQDMTRVVNTAFVGRDGCPFETETECNIWKRKPIIRETVSPRSPKIRTDSLMEFVSAARCNKEIDASADVAAPLLERYQMLMRSARACCTEGMSYSLQQAGASEGLIYKFLADDANFYGLGARCLMMTDKELDTKYPNTATAAVAADVRNGCLCRGRQWFTAMLAPFQQVYDAYPEFKTAKFYYTYTDGLQRKITVSINNDVQNVMKQLAVCP